MTAPRLARLLVVALLIVVCVSLLSQSKEPPAAVSVKQFGAKNVIGRLGRPLGTVVRITGTCIDGDRTRRRADLGKTLLVVRTVNGTKLDDPLVVPLSSRRQRCPKAN